MEDLVKSLKEFYNGKSVFVTGHTGFKGTWLTRTLLMLGAKVTGYALDAPTSPSMFALTDTGVRIQDSRGDIRDLAYLKLVFDSVKPEVVFHFAAQPIVRQSYQDPVTTYSTNVMGTVNLMESIRLSKSVRTVVNVTTDKVYENKEWIWGYRENENLCGYDPYSNSKSCSELVTYSYHNAFFLNEGSPSVSTARSGNVIGGGDFAKDRIIPDSVRAVMNNEQLVVRNPHSIRPYQHVLECLYGYLVLAMFQYSEKNLEGAYNFGPNEDGCVTTGMLSDLFFDAWGNGSWKTQGDSGPHEASYLRLDCSKAKQNLGWSPRWGIEEAVRRTVEWYKEYVSGNDMNLCTDNQIASFFGL
ncbi:CDP-glucose 4,6-dehydratase [Pleomorphochaeta sp. DL1XJH-081]|uniref:CDP-glucose 4,6-dehydratase n=1 Tax=Pleomorphochaeta sp. DL1XJH-081 TaxID=3409690 RepID=UPI003BB77C45